MLQKSDVVNPLPNPESVNHDLGLMETADGVYLDELPLGAAIDVETDHHTYRVENCGDGKAVIVGHPKYCPKPVLVDLHGSTIRGAMLKMRFIGRGMRMEFQHPVLGVISTSPVREIHELASAH